MQVNERHASATATGTISRLTGGFIATALVAGMLLASASGASAQWVRETTCESQWDDSPAEDYCTKSWLFQANATDPEETECDINATCSITFTHGTNGASSTTLTPSTSGIDVYLMSELDDLDICVKETTSASTVSYAAELRLECEANEYTSAQTTAGQFND